MRRRTNGKHRRPVYEYWQSYSDMMAALLLMFILIMVFTLSQSMLSYEDKVRIQEDQQFILDEQSKQMQEQQSQIDELIGIKVDIIRELNKTFLNSNLTIEIDEQTGAISMDSTVLFDSDSSTMSRDGQLFLTEFLPLYMSVLLDDTYRDYVSEIIIEGHTDTDSSYMYNLNLSQERAYSVAQYCLDEKNQVLPDAELAYLRNIMTANGKSFSNPIYNEDGTVDAQKSRRVNIKFRLKDDEMIRQLQTLLDGTPS